MTGAEERFESLLNNLGEVPGNDEEIDALRNCCRAAFRCVPAQNHEAFFADISEVEALSLGFRKPKQSET